MNKFTVHYKSSKRHIKASERDELLLTGQIEPIGDREYRYVQPQVRVFTNLQAIADLKIKPQPIDQRRYLPGSFIFEFNDQRIRELMETPSGMEIRLQTV